MAANLEDVRRPLDLKQVANGWHSANREYSYWIPQADIEGKIPAELKGTLFRNGPGLLEVYGKKLIHRKCSSKLTLNCIIKLFHAAIDGDGMIVALTFTNGRVHLRSRFVVTKEHLEEQQKQKYLYRGQMGTHPNSPLKDTAILLKNLLLFKWPALHYRNPSNTNVFYWGGKVLW